MSYASILVHVQSDASVQYRLRAACDAAKRFDAVLIGMAVEMMRAAPFDDGYTSMDAQWFSATRANALKDQKAAHAQFDSAAADLPHGSLWIAAFDFPAAAIAKAARGADLIVTSRPPVRRNDSSGRRSGRIGGHIGQAGLDRAGPCRPAVGQADRAGVEGYA